MDAPVREASMIGRRSSLAMLIAGALTLASPLAAQQGAGTAIGETRSGPPVAATRWTDPDGKPLPFASDAELLEFLRTAEVKSKERLSSGVTFPTKLLLEKDGVRAHAIFRDVDEEKSTPTFGSGRDDLFFRDNYIFEPAAYELILLLGRDNVPPATLRKLDNKTGSVQIWVENATSQKSMKKKKIPLPTSQQWNKQLQMMNVFDALVYNTDRNSGNVLLTQDGKLWMIDHTRAFRRIPSLQKTASINQCERGMYEKLKTLDEKAVRERLSPYLKTYELESLLKRRQLIVQRLDKLIAELGEAKVLYTYTEETAAASP
jgi:hypothetical protein